MKIEHALLILPNIGCNNDSTGHPY